jgi:23S rRNA pseudouridine1911/1915/1917 synthase
VNSRPDAKIESMGEFRVPAGSAGVRADIFLAEKYPAFTRSSLERLFEEHSVKVGGLPVKPSRKLREAERVEVNELLLRQRPALINLPIIYEDDDVVVINKPEGILSHSKGAMNNESTVASFIAPKVQKELTGNRAGIVHRLDRPTSGLMIAAKNKAAQSKLQKQFSQRSSKKIYLAIVEGVPELPEALIEAPIQRNPKKPQTFRVNAEGKPASTEYKIIKSFQKGSKSYSLLELKPLTGRTHQLRVHLNYAGHPIVGDHLYGHAGEHLYLHAKSLELTLPSAGRRVFTAQPPDYFVKFLES